jgi:hypothetical protein
MHRTFVLLAALVLVTTSGCGLFDFTPPAQESPAAEQRRIVEEIKADHQRLLGEAGDPSQRPLVIFGVDVTGENFFFATCDVLWNGSINLYEDYVGVQSPAVYAKNMEQTENPDLQREAILKLASYSWGQKPPYTTRYDQIAGDSAVDFTVWAAAVRALNRARIHSATPVFIRLLDYPLGRPLPTARETEDWMRRPEDERASAQRNQEVESAYRYQVGTQALVRLEAAKALANIPDDKAVRVITDHLYYDQNKDVRIACADALRNYHTLETARVLVDTLKDPDFSVAYQARKSLTVMTGQDFHFDHDQWLKYFGQSRSPFAG